jgi:hypothetical protein
MYQEFILTNNKMVFQHKTSEIIKTIKSHPYRINEIGLGAILSLPVLIELNGDILLSFFLYSIPGSINNKVINSPFYRVLSATKTLDQINFIKLQSQDDSLGFLPGISLGSVEIKINNFKKESPRAIEERLYEVVDQLRQIYPKPYEQLTNSERQVAKMYYDIFNEIVKKPLLISYRALSPIFFDWLDSINGVHINV